MIAMLYTWQAGDCSAQEPYNGQRTYLTCKNLSLTKAGDFAAAMKGIKAKALVLPCETDLYFRRLCKHQMKQHSLMSLQHQRIPRSK